MKEYPIYNTFVVELTRFEKFIFITYSYLCYCPCNFFLENMIEGMVVLNYIRPISTYSYHCRKVNNGSPLQVKGPIWFMKEGKMVASFLLFLSQYAHQQLDFFYSLNWMLFIWSTFKPRCRILRSLVESWYDIPLHQLCCLSFGYSS